MAQRRDDNLGIACIQCGYDLRVTPLHAHCPECGTAVLHSKPGYRVEGDMLVVYPNANLPRLDCRARLPTTLSSLDSDTPASSIMTRPIPLKRSFLAVASWQRVVAYGIPILLTALLIILPPILSHRRLISPGAASDVGVLIIPMLLLGPLVGSAVLRLVGKECKLTVYTSIKGGIVDACVMLLGVVWFFCSIAVTAVVVDRANGAFGLAAAIVSAVVVLSVGAGGVYALHRSTSIYLVRHADGQFWIKGFGPGYLQTCEAVRARIHEDGKRASAAHATASCSAPPQK
jgi:hypothetical protein